MRFAHIIDVGNCCCDCLVRPNNGLNTPSECHKRLSVEDGCDILLYFVCIALSELHCHLRIIDYGCLRFRWEYLQDMHINLALCLY